MKLNTSFYGILDPTMSHEFGWFDKSTDRVRRVFFLAQGEADRLQSPLGIEPPHIMVGLVKERGGLAARILANLGVKLDDPQLTLGAVLEEGAISDFGLYFDINPDKLSFSPRSERTIALAFSEGRRIKQYYLGTEHLLMGVLLEGQGDTKSDTVSLLENNYGVNLKKVRRERKRLLQINVSSIPKSKQKRQIQPFLEASITGSKSEFLYTVAAASGELIAKTDDFPHRSEEDLTAALQLQDRLRKNKLIRNYRTQDEAIADMREVVLRDFGTLLYLASAEHPLLTALHIEDRPLRAALYGGAQSLISGTKRGLAQQVLDAHIIFADIKHLNNAGSYIVALEDFQSKLIAKEL